MADKTTKEVKREIHLNEVVIYNGSLEELNSRDTNQQYEFADRGIVTVSERGYARPNLKVADPHPSMSAYIEHVIECFGEYSFELNKKLAEKGYNGLVNARTNVIYPYMDNGEYLQVVQGTPIVKKR